MADIPHNLYIIALQSLGSQHRLWVFGIQAQSSDNGVFIYFNPPKEANPIQLEWTFTNNVWITSRESIAEMSAANAEGTINLIKAVRAGDTNRRWMYNVIIALRLAGMISSDSSSKWILAFKPQESSRGPSTEAPSTAASSAFGPSVAATFAAPGHITGQSTAGVSPAQPSATSKSKPSQIPLGQPTVPRHSAGQAAAAKAAAPQPTADKSLADRTRAPPPTASQPTAAGSAASQPTSQSVADTPVASPITAAVISAAERAKLRAMSTEKPQTPPAALSRRTTHQSYSSRSAGAGAGAGPLPADPRSSKKSRTGTETSPHAASGSRRSESLRANEGGTPPVIKHECSPAQATGMLLKRESPHARPTGAPGTITREIAPAKVTESPPRPVKSGSPRPKTPP